MRLRSITLLRIRLLFIAGCILPILAGISGTPGPRKNAPEPPAAPGRIPRILPDYAGVVIPPNIAPLNFKLMEPMDEASLRISSDSGDPIDLKSGDGSFRIPIEAWKKLLGQNRGRSLVMRIRTQKDGRWQDFQPIVNRISMEPVDPVLSYRLINPAYSFWSVMGLYQRNLETFEQKPILVNRLTQDNCMNCHNFRNNDPDCMLFHLRSGPGSGTLIRWKGGIRKVNTATGFNKAGSYPSWHPNGNIIAFSANSLTMFFHACGEGRDVLDSGSDLVLYLIDKNMITSDPGIANPDRMETFPCWSPDGRYLYFCAADRINDGGKGVVYTKIHYDLMRIAYDATTGLWGKPETVLAARQAGGSITMPRISPDGRFLLFTKADYGNFPIYLKSADLYLLDLQTGKARRLECNSDQTDSFHSWSSNGRWFVFSSKRLGGVCARPFFSYLAQDGTASKPVLLPQEDPEFYDTFIKTYNVPELVRGPIDVDPRTWARAAMGKDVSNAMLDPRVKPGKPQSGGKEQKAEGPDLYRKAP
jgi:hypothetical protein